MSLRSLSSSVSSHGSGISRTTTRSPLNRTGSTQHSPQAGYTLASSLEFGNLAVLPPKRRGVLRTPRAASPECLELETDPTKSIEEEPSMPRFPEPNQSLPFTVGDLRRAIPAHCFERSAWRSLSYFFADIIAIGALVYASTFIDALPVATALKYGVLWPAYWYTVGVFGVGLWIVSHECGHGAFSEHNWLNDLVGFFGHSILGVPYFSW